MKPDVKIQPCATGTEVLIRFNDRNYCTRLNFIVADTPPARALQGELFLKRHNARLVEDNYTTVQDSVARTMEADSLIDFATTGGPTFPKRPSLTVVR